MNSNQSITKDWQHNDKQLSNSLNIKIESLKVIQKSIQTHHDLNLYKMLDTNKYKQITKDKNVPDINLELIHDLNDELSHHLSFQLIDYLGKIFPFFYYDEYQLGRFNIYFGNWWDHRLFGQLNVLRLKFNFNTNELNKLNHSFKLNSENKMYNSDKIEEISRKNVELQKLQESKNRRQAEEDSLHEQIKNIDSKSALPWDTNKLKAQRKNIMDKLSSLANLDDQSIKADHTIESNNRKVLDLSKENTILEYEKQSIINNFTDFNQFINKCHNLYQDYLLYLLKKAQGND